MKQLVIRLREANGTIIKEWRIPAPLNVNAARAMYIEVSLEQGTQLLLANEIPAYPPE